MTPFEMDFWREQFDEAALKLGWTTKEEVVEHERDNRSWKQKVWYSGNGGYLFSEEELQLGLLKEIIRLAAIAPGRA